MGGEKKIFLKKGKDQSLLRFHPWVFSGAVDKTSGNPQNGEVVDVYSKEKTFLGRGHYQEGSIMVRMLTWKKEEIDREFWKERLTSAYLLREKMLPQLKEGTTDCFRLVHGEGDYLPGLIVDIYKDTAVMQTHSAGMYACRAEIAEALKEVLSEKITAVYSKSTQIGTFKGDDDYLYKKNPSHPTTNEVVENGCKFYVDWEKGQKTGFFLDQRDNRELVKRYAEGKMVLNLFCYTGGFSVYALKGGALSCTSVDSSQTAIDACVNNLILNGFTKNTESICTDAIDYLKDVEKGKYQLMIVDPPAFAKHLSAKPNALRAYRKLNAMAIEKVAPGGIIFTFSCSQVVDKIDFALAVFSAAAQCRRKVRILHRLTQPADHPVNICHPEGEYLKGLVLYVE
ncbi:MAG: class I SAM-dependent rRNA methyltransferase [Bacteroidales bacterium]|nr:class I SAM-dependent rRNA methyltransferase [Bacteroidales bacterium]